MLGARQQNGALPPQRDQQGGKYFFPFTMKKGGMLVPSAKLVIKHVKLNLHYFSLGMATPRSFGRPHFLLLGQWLEASLIKIANVSRRQARKLGKNLFELVEEALHG
jgi:hypothetical protein